MGAYFGPYPGIFDFLYVFFISSDCAHTPSCIFLQPLIVWYLQIWKTVSIVFVQYLVKISRLSFNRRCHKGWVIILRSRRMEWLNSNVGKFFSIFIVVFAFVFVFNIGANGQWWRLVHLQTGCIHIFSLIYSSLRYTTFSIMINTFTSTISTEEEKIWI